MRTGLVGYCRCLNSSPSHPSTRQAFLRTVVSITVPKTYNVFMTTVSYTTSLGWWTFCTVRYHVLEALLPVTSKVETFFYSHLGILRNQIWFWPENQGHNSLRSLWRHVGKSGIGPLTGVRGVMRRCKVERLTGLCFNALVWEGVNYDEEEQGLVGEQENLSKRLGRSNNFTLSAEADDMALTSPNWDLQ